MHANAFKVLIGVLILILLIVILAAIVMNSGGGNGNNDGFESDFDSLSYHESQSHHDCDLSFDCEVTHQSVECEPSITVKDCSNDCPLETKSSSEPKKKPFKKHRK